MQLLWEIRLGEYKKSIEQSRIIEFNQKYEKYVGRGEGTSEPLTYQDVASIINLANNDNKNQEFPTTIKINFKSNTNTLNENGYSGANWIDDIIEKNKTEKKYCCKEVHINSSTTLVDYVLIDEIP